MKKTIDYIIYHFIKFQEKVGNGDISKFSTTTFFTILIWINLLSLINFIIPQYKYPIKNYIIYVISICTLIFIITYRYIRKEEYSKHNFTVSILGYLYVIIYIVLSFIIFVYSVERLRG